MFFDAAFSPTAIQRSPEQQAVVDQKAKSLLLYQLNACPFCVKVRRALKRLGVTLAMKDIGTDPVAHAELMAGGKMDQVPCLKITAPDGSVQWRYESSEINADLERIFAS